ncbi:MAG: GGDEF domain-containing protein [Limnochordia bacterium]|jgi:diguanylate cyclase (GGDEF)-like protein|nr:GGDEF domain-containing protein [Limnochordia bacterium]
MPSFGRLYLYTGCGFLGLILLVLLIAVTRGLLHPFSLVLPLFMFLSIIGYLGSMLQRLILLVGRDPLTGIANRRFIESFIELPKYHRGYFSLILLDLDNFKVCNDVNGHQHGDIILQEVAEIIQESIRSQDVAARLGGDEFAILLPRTSSQQAYQVAERIRRQIEDESGAKGPKLTASMGVAGMHAVGDNWYPRLFARADRALYQAKKQKNRVAIYPPGACASL